MKMNRTTKFYVLAMVLMLVTAAGLGCWQPHFTHTNAESPMYFENLLTEGHAVFNKNIYPGTLCVGALNSATGEGGDIDLKIYMDVGNSNDLLVYEVDGDTYLNLETDKANALDAIRDHHLSVRPNLNTSTLSLAVDTSNPQYPIFSIPLDELFDSSYGAGTIWEITFNHLYGSTVALKRAGDGRAMPDDRITYVRQGGNVTTDVTLTASTLDAGTVAAGVQPQLTFNRPMGALYAAYFEDGDPSNVIPTLACDRDFPNGGYRYTFCLPSNTQLESGHAYFFALIQECDASLDSTAGCEAGMALSQDMHGNPIDSASLPTGWIQDDLGAVTAQSDTGANVVYRPVHVP
jgi:hypothetical protein